jgi:hypothetical protein
MRLSSSYRLASYSAPTDSPESRELLEKADAAAEAAARASPDPRIASLLRATAGFQKGEWIEAERQLPEREVAARELNVLSLTNPARTKLLYWMAEDKLTQAVAGWEKERAMDPLGEQVAVNLQDAYANAGRFADSLKEKARARSLGVSDVVELGSLHLAIAMKDRRETGLAWERGHALGLWPEFYPLRDRPAEALALLRARLAEPGQVDGGLALWAAAFGDAELALAILKEGVDPDRRWIMALTLWRPIMGDVRKLPGFKELVRELGLVDYWREFGWGDHCKPVGDTDFQCS